MTTWERASCALLCSETPARMKIPLLLIGVLQLSHRMVPLRGQCTPGPERVTLGAFQVPSGPQGCLKGAGDFGNLTPSESRQAYADTVIPSRA